MKIGQVFFLLLVLCFQLFVGLKTGIVRADGALIYIRADGSLDPPTDLIQKNGDIYTLAGDLNSSGFDAGIIIEAVNVTLDGAGHKLLGAEEPNTVGISVAGTDLINANVTIENMEIATFEIGISLSNVSGCHMVGNNITVRFAGGAEPPSYYGGYGISAAWSSNIDISGNNISGNNESRSELGILLFESSNNNLVANNITDTSFGDIQLEGSSENTIVNTSSEDGMVVINSYNNLVEGNVVKNKPLVYLEGVANRAVDDAGQVILVNCNNISVENLSLQGSPSGVELWKTNSSIITDNIITDINLGDGIWLESSSNNSIIMNDLTGTGGVGILLNDSSNWNTVSRNNITTGTNEFSGTSRGIIVSYSSRNNISWNNLSDNKDGIELTGSSNNNILGNTIAGNLYVGIMLDSSSEQNAISQNKIAPNNRDGIWIDFSDNNNVNGNEISSNQVGVRTWFSTGNNIVSNNISLNTQCGVYLLSATGNCFYHNSLINNTVQVSIGQASPSEPASANTWDDGYPSGGNYWSDYNGKDFYSGLCQNVTGSDGIGDVAYLIDANNTDRYPLVASYGVSSFVVNLSGSTGPISVGIMSNSTVSNVNVDELARTLSFNVSGAPGTVGFCRITVPNIIVQSLWNGNYTVLMNGEPCPFTNSSDNENTYIYINYTHSEHQVTIVPEFPSLLILSPENKTYGVSNIPLTFTVDRPVSWMGYSLDGQMNVTMAGNITLALSEGFHSVAVYANSTAGDMGASSIVCFTVDVTSPEIVKVSRNPPGDVQPNQAVTILVNITDLVSGVKSVRITYNTTTSSLTMDFPMTFNLTSGLWEYTILGRQTDTVVQYKITAYDNAENNETDDNAGQYYVYTVIQEFPPFIILPLLVLATLLTAIVYRRKHSSKLTHKNTAWVQTWALTQATTKKPCFERALIPYGVWFP